MLTPFYTSHGIRHMQKLNMKTTGFISNCKQWILLFTFLVNLHITVSADIKCKGPPGYDVSPLTEGYDLHVHENRRIALAVCKPGK